jgi:hypothetical protein
MQVCCRLLKNCTALLGEKFARNNLTPYSNTDSELQRSRMAKLSLISKHLSLSIYRGERTINFKAAAGSRITQSEDERRHDAQLPLYNNKNVTKRWLLLICRRLHAQDLCARAAKKCTRATAHSSKQFNRQSRQVKSLNATLASREHVGLLLWCAWKLYPAAVYMAEFMPCGHGRRLAQCRVLQNYLMVQFWRDLYRIYGEIWFSLLNIVCSRRIEYRSWKTKQHYACINHYPQSTIYIWWTGKYKAKIVSLGEVVGINLMALWSCMLITSHGRLPVRSKTIFCKTFSHEVD